MYSLSKTEVAKSASFLTPGVYRMKPVNVTTDSHKTGTEYMEVTFQTEDGTDFKEKFTLTEKALGRLQYLHSAFFGKVCTKDFKSAEEITAYFLKYLTGKPITKSIVVGGEIAADGKIYGQLPYTDFVDADENFELGEFEEGSPEWKKFVKRRTGGTSEVEGKNGILNDDEDEQIGKKAEKAESKTTEKSKSKAKPEASKEEADDDLPW